MIRGIQSFRQLRLLIRSAGGSLLFVRPLLRHHHLFPPERSRPHMFLSPARAAAAAANFLCSGCKLGAVEAESVVKRGRAASGAVRRV